MSARTEIKPTGSKPAPRRATAKANREADARARGIFIEWRIRGERRGDLVWVNRALQLFDQLTRAPASWSAEQVEALRADVRERIVLAASVDGVSHEVIGVFRMRTGDLATGLRLVR